MRKQATKIIPVHVFLGFDSTKKLSGFTGEHGAQNYMNLANPAIVGHNSSAMVGAAIDGGERKLRHRQNSNEIRGLGIWERRE